MRVSRSASASAVGPFGCAARRRDDPALPDALVVHAQSGVDAAARAAASHARPPSPRCDRCSQRSACSTAAPRPSHAAWSYSQYSKRCGARHEFVAVARHEVGPVMIGLRRAHPIEDRLADVQEARAAGPAQELAPVADRKSQPISSTSRSSCPTAWQASSRNGTPAERASAPISAAGFTSPPFVGTWVNDTSATSPPGSASAIAATDTCPDSSLAHPLDDDPVLLGGAEEGDRVGAVLVIVDEDPLPPLHRHRPERGVPRRRGVGRNGRSRAAEHGAVGRSSRARRRGRRHARPPTRIHPRSPPAAGTAVACRRPPAAATTNPRG